MAYLEETAEFIDAILRLDLSTPVRGFDGVEIGPSNEQAQGLANRTKWLKEVLDAVKSKQDNTRDPEDVMREHLGADDPHPQYVTEVEGDARYLNVDEGNKPNGYLKLDENGYFPADLAKLYEVHYVIVENETERLALEESKNVTICFQRDDNVIYYLNAGADPSVADNWQKGRQTELAPVSSVFGRMDEVIAQTGDYNADQITETKNRQFVTPDNKTTWNGKQEKLISGNNIRTVFGINLLESGDVGVSDIPQLGRNIGYNLIGDGTVEVYYDETQNKVVVKGKNTGSGEGLADLTIKEETVTNAGKEYRYDINGQLNFDYTAQASKRLIIVPKKEVLIDYTVADLTLLKNTLPEKDANGYFKNGETVSVPITTATTGPEKYYSEEISIDQISSGTIGIDITVPTDSDAIMPVFNDSNTSGLYTVTSSSVYEKFEPWKAFQAPLTEEERVKVPNREYWSDNYYFQSAKSDVYLGIKSSKPIYLRGYGFQKFQTYYWVNTSTPPISWIFQGRNEDTDEWNDLDTQVEQNLRGEEDDWSVYQLTKFVGYKQYRLLITNVENPRARTSIPRFQLYNDMGVLIKDAQNKYYKVINGVVGNIDVKDNSDFAKNQFRTTTKPVDLTVIPEENFPIRFCSLRSDAIDITQCQYPDAIVIHDPVTIQTSWDGLFKVLASELFTGDDRSAYRLAVTPDNVNYYIWNDGDWYNIGEYDASDASAKTLLKKGMTIDRLNTVTKTGWKNFVALVKTPQLGIAYARTLVNDKTPVTPKQLNLSFEDVYGWQQMSLDKVKIIMTEKYISFTPSTEGVYKFCYRFN